MVRLSLATTILSMFLAGCAHVMSAENLKLVDRSIGYGELNAHADTLVGKTVLVGGIIETVRSSGDVTMLEVSELELFKNEVPNEDSPAGGRFLAISTELIDPASYRLGKLVTIIGEVKGRQVMKIDDTDRSYPLIAVKELRLFRPSEQSSDIVNPYQNQYGDDKFLRRPPGLSGGEPGSPY